MGVEYDLISDAAREGYELGKGPWGDGEFIEIVRRGDQEALAAYIGLPSDYAAKIATEILQFAKTHPDWRVINDFSSDITVTTDAGKAEMGTEFPEFKDDLQFPVYRQVGSRYSRRRK